MDGICECVVVHPHGCKKCKTGNVQFLFLFDDCSAGIVCQQGVAPSSGLTPPDSYRDSKGEGTGRLGRRLFFAYWIILASLMKKEIMMNWKI